jgi:sugar-specific transcriptional regulator TrmB
MENVTKLKKEKKQENPHIEKLERLGFSRAESLIYVYLLEKGSESGVSKIAVGTGMHRQQVYTTIPVLLNSGVIEEVKEGKVAKYKARPPHQLERVMRRKMVEAETVAEELQKISRLGHEQDFEVIVGFDACRAFEVARARQLKEGEEQYVIGTEKDEYLEMMGPVYASTYVPILEQKKVVTYYIAPEAQSQRRDIIDERQTFHVRVLKNLSAGPLVTAIQGDLLIFYVNVQPVTMYVIRSKKVADGYRCFFDMLWEMSSSSAAKMSEDSSRRMQGESGQNK